MSNIECTGTIDVADNLIKIDTLDTEELVINFSSDIDFTNLVSILTKKIDTGNQIILNIEDPEDEKIKLIVETLKSIFDAYNESLREEAEEEIGDEIPY